MSVVQKIQSTIGVDADGIPGPQTHGALWQYCDLVKLAELLPNLQKPAPVGSSDGGGTGSEAGDRVIDIITKVLAIYEMGSKEFKYGDVYVYNDGPGGKRQVTSSIGFTETGNLQKLLGKYGTMAAAAFAPQLAPFLPAVGKFTLHANDQFKSLLKQAGSDPVMQQAQRETFREAYLSKSESFCQKNGLVLPLSRLIVADSKLHSGTPCGPNFLRKRFAASPPARGGDEKEFISQYTQARHHWLANHSNKLLRNTAKRPAKYLELIQANNWNLDQSFSVEGYKVV